MDHQSHTSCSPITHHTSLFPCTSPAYYHITKDTYNQASLSSNILSTITSPNHIHLPEPPVQLNNTNELLSITTSSHPDHQSEPLDHHHHTIPSQNHHHEPLPQHNHTIPSHYHPIAFPSHLPEENKATRSRSDHTKRQPLQSSDHWNYGDSATHKPQMPELNENRRENRGTVGTRPSNTPNQINFSRPAKEDSMQTSKKRKVQGPNPIQLEVGDTRGRMGNPKAEP